MANQRTLLFHTLPTCYTYEYKPTYIYEPTAYLSTTGTSQYVATSALAGTLCLTQAESSLKLLLHQQRCFQPLS